MNNLQENQFKVKVGVYINTRNERIKVLKARRKTLFQEFLLAKGKLSRFFKRLQLNDVTNEMDQLFKEIGEAIELSPTETSIQNSDSVGSGLGIDPIEEVDIYDEVELPASGTTTITANPDAGSGLDGEILDGIHASEFTRPKPKSAKIAVGEPKPILESE